MRLHFALAIALTLAAAVAAQADVAIYVIDLKGGSEVPPTDSKGSGKGEASYDSQTKKLSWNVTYEALSGPVTAAHFHAPAAAGANAGPAITLDASRLTSPLKGEALLTDAQAADLAKGLWYLNLHTAKHPPGEVRGQLVGK
jgi:hypothetical protein